MGHLLRLLTNPTITLNPYQFTRLVAYGVALKLQTIREL
jgi:hypothetical protein